MGAAPNFQREVAQSGKQAASHPQEGTLGRGFMQAHMGLLWRPPCQQRSQALDGVRRGRKSQILTAAISGGVLS